MWKMIWSFQPIDTQNLRRFFHIPVKTNIFYSPLKAICGKKKSHSFIFLWHEGHKSLVKRERPTAAKAYYTVILKLDVP